MKKHTTEETQKRIRTIKYLEAAFRAAGEREATFKLYESEATLDTVKIWAGKQEGNPDAVANIEHDSAMAVIFDVTKAARKVFF